MSVRHSPARQPTSPWRIWRQERQVKPPYGSQRLFSNFCHRNARVTFHLRTAASLSPPSSQRAVADLANISRRQSGRVLRQAADYGMLRWGGWAAEATPLAGLSRYRGRLRDLTRARGRDSLVAYLLLLCFARHDRVTGL